jgi:hypothetical protein
MNRDAAKIIKDFAKEEEERLLETGTVAKEPESLYNSVSVLNENIVNDSSSVSVASHRTAAAQAANASSSSLKSEKANASSSSLKSEKENVSLFNSIKTKGSATSKVLFLNNKMTLMLLFNAAFGFIAAFDNRWVCSHVHRQNHLFSLCFEFESSVLLLFKS